MKSYNLAMAKNFYFYAITTYIMLTVLSPIAMTVAIIIGGLSSVKEAYGRIAGEFKKVNKAEWKEISNAVYAKYEVA